MAKFRKKPVEIEAWCTDGVEPRPLWLKVALGDGRVSVRGACTASEHVIQTLEGDMTAQWGDWIIKGVKGELYPCKPDIFAATYDPV